MSTIVDIRATPINRLFLMYNRIRIYRSATVDGVFAEITAAPTRLVLTTAQTDYLYVDGTGDATSWYKYEFTHTDNANTSGVSAAFQGKTAFEQSILSVDDLKQFYLFGLPLSDPRTGQPLPDSFFQYYIDGGVTYTENILDVDLRQKTRTNEKYDFIKPDYERFMWIKLLHQPVISVSEVRMSVDGSETNAVVLDSAGYRIDNVAGHFEDQVLNNDQLMASIGINTLWVPFYSTYRKYAPQVFSIDYVSGFAPGRLPADLRELVGRVAAIGPLSVLGDLIAGVGIAGNHVNLDMLATKLTTTKSDKSSAFSVRIRQYKEEINDLIKQLRLIYRGIPMVVV